jgi:CheY-like chemotaxis protein
LFPTEPYADSGSVPLRYETPVEYGPRDRRSGVNAGTAENALRAFRLTRRKIDVKANRMKANDWRWVGAVSSGPVRASKVLVVDDYRDAADLLAEALRARGHDTRTAFDGQAAVVAATEFRPDIVFLDIGLPIMDGYEVVQELRKLPGGTDMYLVAVTGYSEESDQRRSREAGFDTHLVKPIDIRSLDPLLSAAAK